ncbi:RimJ/RimL family protein N-acetyltransferase [Kribbella orskensis]|uniref:RimJ/RimL family protein N-acetyltransferase n=1 Tax=Kribbella orskensis TaxID=2512216 RepID=A0ABY2BG51_9ACTN|nr:RimJ/RimL family protein N-acetyltransferase [Kribbella sp. VKM Ac-2500]TCO19401.1 RimJ/RimL family protein N-acetyltransferase [Kribbella orskensis]
MGSVWVGERVRLRGVEPEDWEEFKRFDQDSEVQRNADMVHVARSDAGYVRWAEEQSLRKPENDEFQLAIEALENDTLVGALSTNGTSRRAGRFSFGIAIGRNFHRRGYASDALVILLRFMFAERRYHKAEAGIYGYNQASIALHESLGFTHEGILRDHEFLDGAYQDMVLMGITAEEFSARHMRR